MSGTARLPHGRHVGNGPAPARQTCRDWPSSSFTADMSGAGGLVYGLPPLQSPPATSEQKGLTAALGYHRRPPATGHEGQPPPGTSWMDGFRPAAGTLRGMP